MSFTEAIQSGFRNYVGFSGRAARSEYWYWVLFIFIVGLITSGVDHGIVGGNSQFSPVTSIVGLALLLPNLGMAVRRLHDLDKSGWFLLLGLIPIIGVIILLFWFVQRGTVGDNRFGPDPLASSP
jgi:uncharacterized membrane protein YhaH (DUF805 family)